MNVILSPFHWILDASLRASLLAVAILLLQAALRGVISARSRYGLWLPVLLVLILPVLPQSRWSVENLFTARTHAPMPASAPVVVTLVSETSPVSPAAATSSLHWKETAAAILWAAGAVLSFGGGLLLYRASLRRFLLNAEEPDSSLTRMIASLSAELRLHRPPRLVLSRTVESPAVTGLLRPLLLLPADFSTAYSGNEARLVLKHELMHLKRFDLQINALVFLLNTLHWFNPLLWLAIWRVRQDRETACDAQVLASEPSDCRRDYGHVLLKAESVRFTPWLSIGFVGIFEPGRVLRSRIKAIARYRRPGPLSAIVAGAAILLLAILGATHAQTNPPEAAPATGPGQAAELTYSQGKSIMISRLNRIIIPRVDFHDAPLREVADFLRQKSVDLDSTESDPAQRGVNIVMQLSGTGPPLGKVTLSLTNKSLASVLQSVCQSANIEMKIDPYAVSLFPAGMLDEELNTNEYRLSSSLAAQIAPGRQAAMDFLTAHGVHFPPGASAVYFPAGSRLIVHDTSSNLDLIDALVVKFPGPPPPPTPTPVPGSIEDKLSRIIIPKIDFRDATTPEAIDYLRQQSIHLDTNEPDPSRRGVKITLAPGTSSGARITLSLTNIPLITALRYVCQLTNLKLAVSASEVLIIPGEASTPPPSIP